MKKLTIILLAMLLPGLACVNAQVPRVRTSAPAEKTAQKGGKAPKAKTASAATDTPAPGKKGGKKGKGNKAAATPAFVAPAESNRYMAIKTNLLYDAVAVLNLSYECRVAPHWSVELPVMWSLWDCKDDRGLRTVALQPGAKYWFSRPGSGHAVGASFDVAWYNCRWNDNRYQSEGRPAMGASVMYAYTLRLGRGWNAEFALGVGYVNTRYNTYFNIADGALIDTRTRHYFGPTRLGISLAYAF